MPINTLSASRPSTRPVQPDDYQRAATFMAGFRGQFHTPHFWQQRFAFWWDNNPFYQDSMARGWLLEAGGNILGFLGCIQLGYQWNHQPCLAMTPSSWDLLPDYRQYALHLFVEQLDVAENALLWDTTPTSKVRQVSLRLGLTPVAYPYGQHFYIFKDLGSLAMWHLRAKGSDSRWPTRIQQLEKIFKKTKPSPPKTPTGYRVESLPAAEAVDDAFDHLWERTGHLKSHTKIRSAKWVRWYCFGFSFQPKFLFGCYTDKTLVAFAIFRTVVKRADHSGALPVKFLECLDFWHDLNHPRSPSLLMDHALHFTREHSMLGLAVYDYPPLVAWLNEQLFTVHTSTTPNGLYLLPSAMKATAQQESTYFLLGEGDVGL